MNDFTASIEKGNVAYCQLTSIEMFDALETLEVLIVRFGERMDRADADQFGPRLDFAEVMTKTLFAVVYEAVDRPPIVGQLHANDNISWPMTLAGRLR